MIVVDDGVATGLTDMAALRLRQHADQVVCLLSPPRLRGVGEWYCDFSQASDEQVLALGEFSDVAA